MTQVPFDRLHFKLCESHNPGVRANIELEHDNQGVVVNLLFRQIKRRGQ